MNSYTAHIVLGLDVEESHESHVAREVCVLVKAESVPSAWEHAQMLGQAYDGQRVECPAGDAVARFVGIRKIVACTVGPGDSTPVRQLVDGVELTSVDLEFAQQEDLERLAEGEIVNLAYDA